MRRELVWTHDFLGRQTGVVSRGLLSLVTDCTLDGAETLSLTLPADDPKVPLLVEGTELRHRDARWVITEVGEKRSGPSVVVAVEAIAAWNRLSDLTLVGETIITDRTVAGGGRQILTGTPWNVGPLTAESGDHQMQESDMTVLAAARRWATITGTLLVFDTAARTIDWVPTRGVEVGLAFRHGRNISSLERLRQPPTITELWPYGADGLTIAGINGGVPYLEDYTWFTDRGVDINFARSRQKRRVVWSDPAITSESDLLAAAQAVLDAAAGGSETIKLSVVDISSITGVAEDLRPGDRVRALDPMVGDEFEATVTRVRRDWLAPSKGSIELSTSPQTVASPASSSRPSATLQWRQFTGRVAGEYRVRNDGTWTLARVALRFGESGQGHMAASVQLIGVGDGRARVWIHDVTDDVIVRSVEVDYVDGEAVPVTLTAGVPSAAGRHDYRLRITTEAEGGADPDAGVDVAPDPASVAAFWVMAWGAVQETPPPVTSVTFDYTGAVQSWTVPDNVTEVTVEVRGAEGRRGGQGPMTWSGRGGVVVGVVPVTPGSDWDVVVGESPSGEGTTGGWPNGGDGAGGSGAAGDIGGGGGGASWICLAGGSISSAPVVAAGGGGGGAGNGSGGTGPRRGGDGGLFVGGDGASGDPAIGGGGATQWAGGRAATGGVFSPTAGSAGQGGQGDGGNGVFAKGGGGGGGGRYGGGGGEATGTGPTDPPGGGGGGSGWVDPDVYDVQVTDGGNSGHGKVTITWDA